MQVLKGVSVRDGAAPAMGKLDFSGLRCPASVWPVEAGVGGGLCGLSACMVCAPSKVGRPRHPRRGASATRRPLARPQLQRTLLLAFFEDPTRNPHPRNLSGLWMLPTLHPQAWLVEPALASSLDRQPPTLNPNILTPYPPTASPTDLTRVTRSLVCRRHWVAALTQLSSSALVLNLRSHAAFYGCVIARSIKPWENPAIVK